MMKKLVCAVLMIVFLSQNLLAAQAEGNKNKKNNVKAQNESVPDVSFSSDDVEELIPVNVKNEFDELIKVKLDKNREYPVGPKEKITLGKRKPGKYTLTVYNKKGEFVDNLTRNIDKKNKFVLNEKTVQNANKITSLSTGQKVAIAAGSVGALALGGALLNQARQNEQAQQDYYPSPQDLPIVPQNVQAAPPYPEPQPQPEQPQLAVLPPAAQQIARDNAFVQGGKSFKFLNAIYPQATLIVEDQDGYPVGSNWVIPKADSTQRAQPLIYDGKEVAISSNQKIKVITPDGYQLQRYAFELDQDASGDYVWILE